MIDNFSDFCLWTYVVVDDIWQQIGPLFRHPGPTSACSESELLTMALVGECRGWDMETELLAQWSEHPDLFPHLPSQSRFNRRRRRLGAAFNLLRRAVLGMLDLAADRQTVVDSLPVPVLQFHLVPHSPAVSTWKSDGAAFGKVPTKKQTIFGYKLHLLVTLSGVILDFELAPANVCDLLAGEELLVTHHDLDVLGDKGYISEPLAIVLHEECGIVLHTLPRANQHRQVAAATRRRHNALRQIIETVNSQLANQFRLEVNHAHTVAGLCTRLLTKLAAHTLCIYLNRLCGNASFLQVKSLAFSK
jgi:hypothetical protein